MGRLAEKDNAFAMLIVFTYGTSLSGRLVGRTKNAFFNVPAERMVL